MRVLRNCLILYTATKHECHTYFGEVINNSGDVFKSVLNNSIVDESTE